MSYPDLPDRRIAYDVDGTSVWRGTSYHGCYAEVNKTVYNSWGGSGEATNDEIWNDGSGYNGYTRYVWFFFPEQRHITGIWAYLMMSIRYSGYGYPQVISSVQGSNDTTDGMDGTWDTATGTVPPVPTSADSWRSDWKTLSWPGGPYRTIRIVRTAVNGWDDWSTRSAHLYGHKGVGQTPDDLIFIDNEGTNQEWTLDPNWGGTIYGATSKKQFKVKNTSGSLTANTVTLSCIDTDSQLSSDDVQYGSQVDIASIGPGATSAIVYIRCIPLVGSLPGPRYARVTATIGSWA